MSEMRIPAIKTLLTQGFATNFPASITYFVPSTLVQFIRSIAKLSSKRYYLANDQFRYGAGVTERRVENCNPMLSSVLQVNLVCSYTKTSDYNQVLGFS